MDREALLEQSSRLTVEPLRPAPSLLPGERGFPWTGLTLCVVITGLLAFLAIPRPRPQNRVDSPPALRPEAAEIPSQEASPIR